METISDTIIVDLITLQLVTSKLYTREFEFETVDLLDAAFVLTLVRSTSA